MAPNKYDWLDLVKLKEQLSSRIIADDLAKSIELHLVPYRGLPKENMLLRPHSSRNAKIHEMLSLEVDNLPGACFCKNKTRLAQLFCEKGALDDSVLYESISTRYLFPYRIEHEVVPRLVTDMLIVNAADGVNVVKRDYIPGWFGLQSKYIDLPPHINPSSWYLRNVLNL